MKDISRYEKKYAVSQYESITLYQLLRNVLEADENANGDDGYLVRSLYFDTPFHKDFYEKVDGLHERCKVRLRIYHPDSPTAKLELKEKSGDLQRKRSLNLSREQAIEMIHGDYECLREIDTPFSNYMYAYMRENLYKPKCVVEYKRLAFCVQANDIRITLDSELSATEANYNIFQKDLMLYPVEPLMATVLEVKYNNFLFSYVKDLVGIHNRVQVSESKYCRARGLLLSE